MNKILYFFVLSFLLLSFESRGMDESSQPKKPPLRRVQSQHFCAIDTALIPAAPILQTKEKKTKPIKQSAKKIGTSLNAENDGQKNISRSSIKKKSFNFSKKNSQAPELSLNTLSGTELIRNHNDSFEDDEGFPQDDGGVQIDIYLSKKDDSRIIIPRHPLKRTLNISRSRERTRNPNLKSNAAPPIKRRRDSDSKKQSKTPPPKKQKTLATPPKPVQIPRKKPRGQRPTS